ncbi:hypothetical protein VTK26DRAFT_8039 [Humicola hyalothermophila]
MEPNHPTEMPALERFHISPCLSTGPDLRESRIPVEGVLVRVRHVQQRRLASPIRHDWTPERHRVWQRYPRISRNTVRSANVPGPVKQIGSIGLKLKLMQGEGAWSVFVEACLGLGLSTKTRFCNYTTVVNPYSYPQARPRVTERLGVTLQRADCVCITTM